MTPTITAFARSPDRGRGLVRDMRVRWAIEEGGQPYDVRLVLANPRPKLLQEEPRQEPPLRTTKLPG